MKTLLQLRTQINTLIHADEHDCVEALLAANLLNMDARKHIVEKAAQLVERAREQVKGKELLDDFLVEFGLSNKEGIALMCLAEALLRIPDSQTADKLIAEKMSIGDWRAHAGRSESLFVNASTWGLMLTGKIIHDDDMRGERLWFDNMLNRLGEPIVRRAMKQAMKILGGHYVLGRTILEAMKRADKTSPKNTVFSFDMLGEGARTHDDAEHYFMQYHEAIKAIGKKNTATSVMAANSISVKLSALHPRYEIHQKERLILELLPKIITLATLAKHYNIGLTLDAEEARRLDLSLDIFEKLIAHPDLQGWGGLGFVLQAYQKRAPMVANWLVALATHYQQKISVRLVKGAYWDSEIKYAQEHGYQDYPVYTRKVNTDLSYQICAQILFSAQDVIFPQFATHNAYTIALVMELGENKQFELQRLHGMGRVLYQQLQEHDYQGSVRIYAPVGAHKDLLPYLVRRLLENGANSSFVHRFLDNNVPLHDLISDVMDTVNAVSHFRHSKIPLPTHIFNSCNVSRLNSLGFDLDSEANANELVTHINDLYALPYCAESIISETYFFDKYDKKNTNKNKKDKEKKPVIDDRKKYDIINPSNGEVIGFSSNACELEIHTAMTNAKNAQHEWNSLGIENRALILEKIADLFEQNRDELVARIVMEAGRTIKDALNEIREAVDFCRYYAQLARQCFAEPTLLTGPTGEQNQLFLEGRGVFICISPWNFPLAIFTGQIVAALVVGNTVVAKPAEQTPLVAQKAVQLMHAAGVMLGALQLILGDGKTGEILVKDEHVAGVVFTGSTQTAKRIQRSLAESDGPIVPFIAETGGQNAMIVDSSALLEQVTDDIIMSAFLSAGQRCSSLRVLFVQADIADSLIDMLQQACNELVVGDPAQLATDIGPVIDKNAFDMLSAHILAMESETKVIYQYPSDKLPKTGTFIGPHIVEIDNIAQLQREFFGPILHVIRWQAKDLDKIVDAINTTQFGLTLGIHTRIESRAQKIFTHTHVGNTYVNRNMVGAVVGVNPFGGQGLSGTGPKAGGPQYLFRFAAEKTLTINKVATGGNAELLSISND